MTDTGQPVLETGRLTLHRISHDASAFVLELFNDPTFIRFIGDRDIRSKTQAARWIRDVAARHYEAHGFGLYCLRLRADATLIGVCGLIRRDYLPHPDLGFALLADWRGMGFAHEAARAVLDDGFGSLRLPTVLAIVQPDNAASIRLLRELEFVRAGSVTPPGETIELMRWRRDAPAWS